MPDRGSQANPPVEVRPANARPLACRLALALLTGGVFVFYREPNIDLVTHGPQAGPIPWWRLPLLSLLLYAITTPLGFGLLVVSAARIWRRWAPQRAGVGG